MKSRAREAARNFLRPRHIPSILWTEANGKRGKVTSMWEAAVVQADSWHWRRREQRKQHVREGADMDRITAEHMGCTDAKGKHI